MYNLENCPICGGTAKLIQVSVGHDSNRSYTSAWEIKCCDCGLALPKAVTTMFQAKDGEIIIRNDGAKELVEKWNNRCSNNTEKSSKCKPGTSIDTNSYSTDNRESCFA